MQILAAVPLDAQQQFDTVQVRWVRVADRTYMPAGAGGNIGVSIGESGSFWWTTSMLHSPPTFVQQ